MSKKKDFKEILEGKKKKKLDEETEKNIDKLMDSWRDKQRKDRK